MKIKLALSILLFSSPLLTATSAHSKETEAITLRVALYPYVPNRLSVFHKLEKAFEANNPGVNLELVEDSAFTDEYYSGGLQNTVADVYEVDTILLSELVKLEKLSPIDLPKGDYSDSAIAAVTRDGKTYAVPHWQCGNFLFYKKNDTEIANAETWNELNAILLHRNESILFDFKGKSTLGEWYLTGLSGVYGVENAQKAVMEQEDLNSGVVENLKKMLVNCPDGFCRSNEFHDRTGFYAREFISGKSSTYIGYSESISYGLQYLMDSCTKTSGCLSAENIGVRKLPNFSIPVQTDGIKWVDGLAVDSKIDDRKKELANKFIRFVVSDGAYKTILEPSWGEAPAYLLPARNGIIIDNAPLYSSFYSALSGRKTGMILGLNDKLRQVAKKLDCKLPIERSDIKTQTQCPN